jgi:coenzyme F420 hydrogenase subunit beta
MKKINKIIKSGLCLGCGLCETICTKEKCEMRLNDSGFYYPYFKRSITKEETKKIVNSCPGIHAESSKNTGAWGNMKQITEAWSSDSIIRKKGSSGGVLSTLAIFLLENKKVDAVLQVGVKSNSYLYNELKVSKTKEDVLLNAASRYAPALVFTKLQQILNSTEDIYAFIGKPCDIAGIKNFIKEYPIYKNRIQYFLTIFCAGMPSYNGTHQILKLSGNKEKPISLKYRGDGWPGLFEAQYNNIAPFQMSYNDSWGKVLGKHLGFRCKICPDGIGLLADISVGDSWNTKNGYPDFEESDGRSFVMVRTTKGQDLFNEALKDNCIVARNLDINKIEEMQQYQYQRRLIAGYRILPVQFLTGMLLNFKGLGIYNLMCKANKKDGLKNMLGTVIRFIKKKYS